MKAKLDFSISGSSEPQITFSPLWCLKWTLRGFPAKTNLHLNKARLTWRASSCLRTVRCLIRHSDAMSLLTFCSTLDLQRGKYNKNQPHTRDLVLKRKRDEEKLSRQARLFLSLPGRCLLSAIIEKNPLASWKRLAFHIWNQIEEQGTSKKKSINTKKHASSPFPQNVCVWAFRCCIR